MKKAKICRSRRPFRMKQSRVDISAARKCHTRLLLNNSELRHFSPDEKCAIDL